MYIQKDKEFETRYNSLRQLINNKYSLYEIIHRYNQEATEETFKMSSILNVHDSNPSFNVNYPKRVWKCFSTGKGGGYLELLYWTQKIREGSTHSIYRIANDLLKADEQMQRQLGFNSLYRDSLPETVEFNLRPKLDTSKKRFHKKPFKRIVQELSSLEDKHALINLIDDYERGMSMEDLQIKYSDLEVVTIDKDDKKELETLITNLFG